MIDGLEKTFVGEEVIIFCGNYKYQGECISIDKDFIIINDIKDGKSLIPVVAITKCIISGGKR